jgi:uncharacterized protein
MDDPNCTITQLFRRLRPWSLAALGIVSCLSAGCQTWQKNHESAISSFGVGDLEISRTALADSQKSLRAEKKLLELDQAILELASGDVRQAEGRFRNLRHELEFLEQKDVTEQASSMLMDSRAVAYSGRDFERRMVLNMALMTSIFGDGQDSFAYSLQVTEAATKRREAIAAKLNKDTGSSRLAESHDTALPASNISPAGFVANVSSGSLTVPTSSLDQPLALSSYLAAAVQSESPTRHQETEAALSDIGYWNPAFLRHDKASANGEFGTRCKAGHGTVHIIALVGKAPRWVSESAEPTSAALLIADRIISATGKHTLPPTIASVKIAKPEATGYLLPAGSLRCVVGPSNSASQQIAASPLTFSTVVDMHEVAQASYNEHRDQEIAAAITRRVMKKGAVYVLKETQNIHRNSLVDLGINVAGIAWEAMEKADTRSWRMLPGRIDIARAELPAGQWTTKLQITGYGTTGRHSSVPIHIADGRNTYILCIIPEREFTGNILVGGADNHVVPAGDIASETN